MQNKAAKIRTVIEKPLLTGLILAIMLEAIVELLSRRSFSSLIEYIFGSPVIVLCNIAVIMLTLSIAFFFKRRAFVYAMVSVGWIALGVTNCFLLSYRSAPLNMSDFHILRAAIGVASLYITIGQVILFAVAIIAVVAGIVFIWKKAPKNPTAISAVIPVLFMLMVSIVVARNVSVKVSAADISYDELYETYADYGFAYCFARSVVDTGIERPADYSKEAVDEIIDSITRNKDIAASSNTQTGVNVVFVQLESFFDVDRLSDLIFSESPTPIWNSLREKYPSGYLTVPAVGAGTAKTEFEMLCAMNIDYFGLGECPYFTVLKQKSCDSLASLFKSMNYSCTAIHNNIESFYDRNIVYSNLGFDDFISIEDMPEAEYNSLEWAKDKVVYDDITDIIKSQPTADDFIFAVTVQAHGKYPEEQSEQSFGEISTDADALETDAVTLSSLTAQMDYYINQLHEIDSYIGEFLNELEVCGEPTIVVLYGDHLPSFDYELLTLDEGSYDQTEYVIWNNMNLPVTRTDLSSYQLSSHVLSLLNIDGGAIATLHNNFSISPKYLDMLRVLEYDSLYGEHYAE